MSNSRRTLLVLLLVALLTLTAQWGVVWAASGASVTVTAPSEVMLGESFPLSLTFDNTGPDTGYGPIIDFVLPTSGADGNDGLSLNGISYGPMDLGGLTTELVFQASEVGEGSCVSPQARIQHPFFFDISHQPLDVCGTPGDTLVIVELPFGSFTPAQPAATITADVTLSNLADLTTLLPIRSRGGFRFGDDALDNFCCDLIELTLTSSSPDSNTWPDVTTVTPMVMEISKVNDAPEDETATGPNFERTYTIAVEIAPGQEIGDTAPTPDNTPLTISDMLDEDLMITDVTVPAGASFTVGGNTVTPTSASPYDVAAGGEELLVLVPDASGVVEVEVTFWIGDVLVAAGVDQTITNSATAQGGWTPLDGRDIPAPIMAVAPCPTCPGINDVLEISSVEIQKGGSLSEVRPGDTVAYTINFQVSDYHTVGDIIITDVISDGQHYVDNSARIAVGDRVWSIGATALDETGTSISCGGDRNLIVDLSEIGNDTDAATDGSTTLTFCVSDFMVDNSATEGGVLQGGYTEGLSSGPALGQITYQTTVLENYTDTYPSGDSSVDHGDTMQNDVDINVSVLDPANHGTILGPETDDSGANLTVAQGENAKSIFAISTDFNTGTGIYDTVRYNPTSSTDKQVSPGDMITFRLRYDMPSTDFENFIIMDYLPLPVLDANDVVTFDNAQSNGTTLPVVGHAMYGPDESGENAFYDLIDGSGTKLYNGLNTPTIIGPGDAIPPQCIKPATVENPTPQTAIALNENTVGFCFGDYDDPSNTDTFIDILFSVVVSDDPFADDLFLTNFSQGGTGSTQNNPGNSDALIAFTLREPILMIKKGVVDTTNPNEDFDIPSGESVTSGVDVGTAGQNDTPIPNTLTGSDVDGGLDADVGGVDSSDTIRYAVTIQNTGGSAAFDIELRDSIPVGLTCDSGTVNLNIMQGDGTVLSYTDVDGNPTADPCIFFNAGIELIDPAEGACQHATVAPGKEVILITYDLEIDNGVGAGDILTNTTTLTQYTGQDESQTDPTKNHLYDNTILPRDSASVTIASSLDKTIVSTSESDSSDVAALDGSSGNERPVFIGEVVTYRLVTQIPEGTTNNLRIIDYLPDGLQYVDGSAVISEDNSTGTWTAPAPTITGGASPGADITFSFGNVVNTDNDDDAETVIITFNAVVSNIAGNDDGVTLTNNAELWVGTAVIGGSGSNDNPLATSEDRIVTIDEPTLALDKGQDVTSGDAGDTIEYTIVILNNGNAPAYNIAITDTLPAEVTFDSFGTSSGDVAPTTSNEAAGIVTFEWDVLPVGQTSTVIVNVTVNNTVEPNDNWGNTASVVYTSLPGDNGTGDVTPGGPGTDNGERNGSDGVGGAVDDYAAEDTTVLFTVNRPAITKELEHPISNPPAADGYVFTFANGYGPDDGNNDYLDSTSDASTGTAQHAGGRADIAIGETYNYIITVTLPEGTTRNVDIFDHASPLVNAGDVGREVIDILSASVIHVGANLGIPGSPATPPTFTVNPVEDISSAADGDGTRVLINADTPDPLDLPNNTSDILNTPDGVVNDDDRVVIRVTVRMDDEDSTGGAADQLTGVSNNDGDIVNNRARIDWDDSTGDRNVSSFFSVDIVEPNLTITKVASASVGDAGDPITYTITVDNNAGTTTAYDVQLIDALPTYMTFASMDYATSTCDERAGYADTPLSNFSFGELGDNESCTLVFTATIDANAPPNATLTNTATVTYTSQPGTVTDDNRSYGPTDATADVVVHNVEPLKEIIATSEDSTDNGDVPQIRGDADDAARLAADIPVAIGEVVTFQLSVAIPEGQSDNVVLSDVLVPGLAYIAGSTTVYTSSGDLTLVDVGAVATSAPGTPIPDDIDGTPTNVGTTRYDSTSRTVEINLGDITNGNDNTGVEQVVVRFNVVVVNDAVTGDTSGDGVNSLGDIWANEFDVSVDGNTPVTSNSVDVVVQEPVASVLKSIDAASSSPSTTGPFDAGDTVVYDIVVSNASTGNTSAAFDLDILDDVSGKLNLDSVAFQAGATGATMTLQGDHALNNPGRVHVVIDQLDPGETVTIEVTTTVLATVTPAEIIANQADLTYTSLPGDQGTGDVTPGNSGDADGERNGNGVGENDYTDTSSVDFTVSSTVATVKSIAGTSEAHTDDTTADTNAAPRPLAVGEIITYRLVTDIPELTSPDVLVTDILSPNIEYIDGSARISYFATNAMTIAQVPGALNEIDPTTPIPASQVAFDGGARELTFALGQVVNNDSDNAEVEQLIIEFEALVVNTSDNTLGAIWANDYSVDLDNDGTDESTSNEVYSEVHEPEATITKSIDAASSSPSTTGPFDAGDTVVYDIVVSNASNANTSAAFDLDILDDVSGKLNLDSVVFQAGATGAAMTLQGDHALNNPGRVHVVIDQLDPGETVTIEVTTTVLATVTPAEIIANQADLTYTSLPGDQGTGDATPGNSGDADGERNGNGVGENDYTDTSSVDFTVSSTVATVKSIAGTSEAHTDDTTADTNAAPRPLAVGEIITYRLVTDIPELTSPDVLVTDILSPNIEYIDGSARISYFATNAMTIAQVPGALNEIDPTVTIPASQVVFDGGSRELTFALGQVVNNDSDNAEVEQLIIEFEALVVNTSDNTLGAIWANDYSVDLDNDGTDDGTSNEVFSVVQEPEASIVKTINTTLSNPSGVTVFDSGDTVVYDIVVSNASNANTSDAFDLYIVDDINAKLGFTPGTAPNFDGTITIVNSTISGPVPVNASDAAGVKVSVAQLLPGEAFTIRVTTTVLATVTQAEVIDNRADLTYTSLPGDQGTGDVTPGNSGDTDGERNGNGIGENDYTDTSNAPFTVSSTISLGKSIDGTDLADTSDVESGTPGNERPVAIGEVITYRLVAELPNSTTTTFDLDDTLVAGIEYVPGSARVSYLANNAPTFVDPGLAGILNEIEPAFTFPAANVSFDGGTRVLTFAFGSIVNNDVDGDAENLILEFQVRVIDDVVNNIGQIWANDFTQISDEGLLSELTQTSNEIFVQIVEPVPTLVKTFTPDEQVRGQSVTMTLVASNLAADGANAPLYDIAVTDILDDWLDVTQIVVAFNGTAQTFGSAATDNSVLNTGFASTVTDNINIAIDKLPVDGVATITVTMQIDPSVDPLSLPRTITNDSANSNLELTGDSYPDNDANDRDYSTTTTADLDVVKPDLIVTKTDSVDPVAAGGALTYTITVQNNDDAGPDPDYAATNVVLTDELPSEFTVTLVQPSQGTCLPLVGTTITCNLGTINPGASATIQIDGMVDIATADGTVLNNIAYVASSDEGNNGNDGDDSTADDVSPDDDDARGGEETTVGRDVDIAVTKVVDDDTPNEGDLITYTMVVTNNGPSNATLVTLADILPTDLTFQAIVPPALVSSGICTGGATINCTFPALTAGDSVTVGVEATVNVGTSGTTINNSVTVGADEPESDTTNNTADVDVYVDMVDLQVTKTASDDTPNEGDTIDYTITVRNNGPAPASGIVLTDTLPTLTGISYVSDDSATTSTTYDSGTGIWTLTSLTLDAGDELSLVITATVDTGASGEPQPLTNTASITSVDQPDSDPTNNTDDQPVVVGGLDLRLSKGVDDDTPDEGQTIVYTLVVENLAGGANATNITVTDVLPVEVAYVSHTAGLTYDSTTGIWTLPSLAAGAEARLEITVTVNAGTSGSTFNNAATITTVDQLDSNPNNNSDDVDVTVNSVDVSLTKDVDNATPDEGDPVVFSMTVTNDGPGPVTGVEVTDSLPVGVTYDSDNSATLTDALGTTTTYDSGTGLWTVGALNNGDSLTLEITATVDAGTSGTTITNIAAVTNTDQTDTDSTNNNDDASIAVSGLDLAVEKTVDNPTPGEGDSIVYSIAVTNNGPAQATNVAVTDDLNAVTGITYDSDNSATVFDSGSVATSYNSGTGEWSIGTIDASETITLEITATVDAGTSGQTLTNTVTITSVDQEDSNPDNNDDDAEITVNAVDIEVIKVVDNPAPAAGDDVTYTITVTNRGAGPATGVIVSENLPLDNVSLTYVSHTETYGSAATETYDAANPSSKFTPGIPSATWDIGDLAGGEAAILTLTVTVEIDSGSINNVATLETVDQPDTNPDNDEDDALITIDGVDLTVTKTVDNETPETGTDVTYSITATNLGPGTATNVVVIDILPAGVSYVDDTAATMTDATGTATSFDPANGTWTIGEMNDGDSLTLEITVTVDVPAGTIRNTAEISGDEPDSNPDNNEDDALINVDSADLSVTKTVDNTAPSQGDIITYTVTVRNDGPNIAYNVELTDSLPPTVIYSGDYVASQGAFDGSLWTVGTIPVGAGASLEIEVEVGPVTGSTVNVAEITASDQVDPDSTPDNGDPTEDDYAESVFAFDPPFGNKTFDASGLPELVWTITWVNPGDAPLPVSVRDEIQSGTTYISGSLSCSSPGTLTVNTCDYDPATREIQFNGVVFPNPGATMADVNSASNRLIISYRMTIDGAVREVNNEAILTSSGGTEVVSNTWVRTGDEEDDDPPVAPGDPEVLLTKSVSPSLLFLGEQATWSIVVQNTSPTEALTNVVVSDTVPGQLRIEQATSSKGVVSLSGQTITLRIDELASHEIVTLTVGTVLVDDSVGETGLLSNTATVVATEPVTDDDTATVNVVSTLPATGYPPAE